MENKDYKIGLFMLPLLTQGGGAEKYFIELARNLNERGIEADVLTMDEKFFQKFARILHIFTRGNFFGKIDISGREKEGDITKQLGEARWIKSSFKNLGITLRNYNIIYSKNELADLFILKLKGYKNIPPVIAGVHTPIVYPETKSFISKLHNFIYSSFLYRWLLKGARVIHVSNSSAKDFIDNKFKLKSELIYYPFSAKHFFDSAQKNKCDIEFDPGKKNIIFFGRIGEQKGIDVLIKIIQGISDNKTLAGKIRINIFGSGDEKYETMIKKLAKKYSFVRFFGHIEHKYMPHILGQQDLMIAPSKWETLPYSILEAQGMGLPVIAFDIPGPNDIIENGKTGFLVKNEEEFFEKIIVLISGQVAMEKDAIAKNIEKKFNPEKIYSELINMFQENL